MKIKLFSCALVVLTLASLAFYLGNNKRVPLNLSFLETSPFEYAEEGVYVSYKPYTSDESKVYLNRDLVSRGYQPIQITIQNNTPHPYSLSPEEVTLPLAKSKHVAMSVTKSAIPRAIAYKIAGFLFWPFLIPGTIDSIRTFRTHLELRRDFAAKSIKKETIPPYATLHRVLFVPLKDYHPHFSLTLKNTKTDKSIQFNSLQCEN